VLFRSRAALEGAVAAGQQDRVPEPAVEREYGIAAVTARIDDLYEQIAARPGPARRAARLAARRTRTLAGPAATGMTGAGR
jgi:hypothetical protein